MNILPLIRDVLEAQQIKTTLGYSQGSEVVGWIEGKNGNHFNCIDLVFNGLEVSVATLGRTTRKDKTKITKISVHCEEKDHEEVTKIATTEEILRLIEVVTS